MICYTEGNYMHYLSEFNLMLDYADIPASRCDTYTSATCGFSCAPPKTSNKYSILPELIYFNLLSYLSSNNRNTYLIEY